MKFDLLIKNGRVVDGNNTLAQQMDIGIKNGRVTALERNLNPQNAAQTIDAAHKLVAPGFIDLHTHYDAEMLVAPGLLESVRHGVTTCFVGSCSISMIFSEPEDASDMFTRVESIPREHVLPILQQKKTWSNAKEYVQFLKQQPFGPNIASYIGHSDLRTSVMGLGRAVDAKVEPTEQELQKMERMLQEGLDCGLLGLSSMTNPWDKVDGDRHRSAALPSVYARWREYRRLHRLLRKNNAILQSAPNLTTKINALFFLFTSTGLFFRRALRTTLITLMDVKADPSLSRLAGFGGNFFNRFLDANFRWQALPNEFKVYSDGVDFIVFEEFPTGEAALHLKEDSQRAELFQQPSYRAQFKKEYNKKFGGRVWHRDFGDALIVNCPEPALIGKTFLQLAVERGVNEVDFFLDCIIEYGKNMRWTTVIANHRKKEVLRNINQPCTLIGFSDAGAHLRNMAFYNFPLYMLQYALEDKPAISIEKAVWKCTGEIADWYGLDTGKIKLGAQADIVVIDPAALKTAELGGYYEAPVPEFGGLSRIVNRNDSVVNYTIINGQIAYENGCFAADVGKVNRFGSFLARASQKNR